MVNDNNEFASESWSYTGDLAFALSDAQKQDLQRRLAAYEANPKAGSTWEEVKARLSGK